MDACFERQLKEVAPQLIAWRRDLHKHPEAGWEEFRTTCKIYEVVSALGFNVHMGDEVIKRGAMMGVPSEAFLTACQKRAIAQGADSALVAQMDGGVTGLWADMDFGGDGPAVALRFDIDCNEVDETQDPAHLPNKEGFASINPGRMHACGHDGHTAVGLGLAKVLAACKDSLKGRVRLVFQPAEEGVRGAAAMTASGAMDGFDKVLGFHIGFQARDLDTVICGTQNFLATTKADVTFIGKPAHPCSAPELGRNALFAACTAAMNVHAIQGHGKGYTRVSVGKLNAGEGRNVIPTYATLCLETRGGNSELNEYMFGQVQRVVKGAAEMWDCDYSIKLAGGAKSGESDPELSELVAECAREMPCYTHVLMNRPLGVSEDYAYFMTAVQEQGGKATHLQVGSYLDAPVHTTCFDFQEPVMERTLELLVRVLFRLNGKNA